MENKKEWELQAYGCTTAQLDKMVEEIGRAHV